MLSFKWLFQLEHTYCVKAIYIARNFKINLVNILCMLCRTRDCMALHLDVLRMTVTSLRRPSWGLYARLPSYGQCYATTHSEWLDHCEWVSVFFRSQLAFCVLKFLVEKGHQIQIPRFLTCMRHVLDESEQFSEIISFHRFQNRPC